MCAPETKRGATEQASSDLQTTTRDFIPFHAAKVQPMQKLLKKNQHLYWNETHEEAFDSVKQALADNTALAAPNESGRFVLETDASAVAIG